jgi:WD40-like Beta Propeller Repeat
VRIIETATLRSTDLLDDPPGGGVFQASFSFDGHWLVFMNLKAIFIAPFRGPGLIPKQEWITVSESGAFDDKPRWAPDANSIYFTSDRDGSRCVWMQRLNGNSKRPVGDAVPIYHSHSGRRSILNAGSPVSEIGVARDRLVFPQNELTGNVWVADWKN